MRSDLIRLAHKAVVFVSIAALVFSPFGDLVNYYAREYLPQPLAEQIAKIIPEVQTASAHTDDVFVFITVASDSAMSSWPVPTDWNPASNSIEVIGGGGGSGDAGNNTVGHGGGGGGGYSKIVNLTFSTASISAGINFGVGASGSGGVSGGKGGNGGHTWFGISTFESCIDNTVCVKAEGGAGSEGGDTSLIAGLGGNFGSTASAVGTTRYAGGNGGAGCGGGDSGGGGGGAGGPNGDGAGNIGGAGAGDTSPGIGGGGGGGGGGSNGLISADETCAAAAAPSTSGAGGNNYLGTGGGAGVTSGAGNGGTNGGGGSGGNDAAAGGAGGAGDDWVTGWGSGGGGGGGGDETEGGLGGKYGGGGGGGAQCSATLCRGGNGIIVIKYTPRAVQSHFQWFNDDYALDSLNNLASISAEDIKASGSEALEIGDISRLRLQIANIDNYGSNANFTTDKFRLEMARAGTSCTSLSAGWDWRTVPITATIASHAFEIADSTQITNGASTSISLLSAPTGAATFTNGYGLDTMATTSGTQTINDNAFTEIEWALKPNATYANTAASYCFRAGWITDVSTTPVIRASMSFTKIASASVQAAAIVHTFTQNDSEWFNNDSTSVQPGSSLTNGSENTSAEIEKGDLPRLRMNITLGTANLSANSKQFDLQYASTSNGPWAEVGTAQAKWAFANNTPTDGDDIITVLVGSSEQGSRQTYEENNPSLLNPRAATNGDDLEYDWALDSAGVEQGVIYYFRMVKSDDTVLTAYNNYPQIRAKFHHRQSGGGGSIEQGSGGGTGQSGGGQGGGDPCIPEGCSGGGTPQGGGGQGGGGGGSPVMFDWLGWWRWFLGG